MVYLLRCALGGVLGVSCVCSVYTVYICVWNRIFFMCVFSRVLCIYGVFFIFCCMCVSSRCFFLFFLRVGRKKWCFWGVPKKGVFSWFLRGLKGVFQCFFMFLFFYFFFYIYFFYFLFFIFYFFIFYFLFFIFYWLSIYNFIFYFIFYFLFLLLSVECRGYKYFLLSGENIFWCE